MSLLGRSPQQSEVEFLRALVLTQQEQIRELELRNHMLADPIAATRLAMAQRLTAPRPVETDAAGGGDPEKKRGPGRSFRASEIDRKRQDRPGQHEDIVPNYKDPRNPDSFFEKDDGQPDEGLTAEPRSQAR